MTQTLSPQFIKAREDFANWYDNKSEETQELIDEISDRTYYIIDEDEYDGFMGELSSYGITTAEQFQDAFRGEHEGHGERVCAEFAEQWVDEIVNTRHDMKTERGMAECFLRDKIVVICTVTLQLDTLRNYIDSPYCLF